MKITHEKYKENPNLILQIMSRYGVPRTIKRLSENEFYIYGESYYIRTGRGFIDFEGGPFIALNGDLQLLHPKLPNKTIIEIVSYEAGYKLTTKTKKDDNYK